MSDQNPIKVIYIEDDLEMIDLVVMILQRRGFLVQGAHGGRQGLEMVFANPPDLILLDLMMPDIEGWDVYQQIKANETTSQIPVIVITARAQPIDRVLGIHVAKVQEYICKPFRPQELLDSIDRVMTRNNSEE